MMLELFRVVAQPAFGREDEGVLEDGLVMVVDVVAA